VGEGKGQAAVSVGLGEQSVGFAFKGLHRVSASGEANR